MTESAKLLIGYTLRRARSTDKWAILSISLLPSSRGVPLPINTAHAFGMTIFILIIALDVYWHLTQIETIDVARTTLIWLPFLLLLDCILIRLFAYLFIPRYWVDLWVIEYNRRLVAYGKLSRHSS